MNNHNWEFLSYQLSDALSAYRNGERIHIKQESSIEEGDSFNQSIFCANLHFGTHVDYPYHFINDGAKSSDYDISFYVLNTIKLVVVESFCEPHLVSVEDLVFLLSNTPSNIECLIIKTGLCAHRYEDLYWNDNIGINKGVANYCKSLFPNIKFIGFDCMSISSVHNRILGRKVHREFFKNNILPIEDMDLNCLVSSSIIEQMIISPYRIKNVEALPVTVFAKILQK